MGFFRHSFAIMIWRALGEKIRKLACMEFTEKAPLLSPTPRNQTFRKPSTLFQPKGCF